MVGISTSRDSIAVDATGGDDAADASALVADLAHFPAAVAQASSKVLVSREDMR